MSKLIATVFRRSIADCAEKTTGFLVPDTDGTLAVHELWVNHWRVTHVPTGRAVMPPDKAKLTTRDQALGFARRFYREITALGFDMKTADSEAFLARVGRMACGERQEFWDRVL